MEEAQRLSKLPTYVFALMDKLKAEAVKLPQPEVHIRGDRNARYEFVGKVVFNCQRAGILKIGIGSCKGPFRTLSQDDLCFKWVELPE